MQINDIVFEGIDCVEILNGDNRIVVTKSFGPRICYFGKKDKANILYWDMDGYERNGWKLYGGHRVWVTRPMADESEDTYTADNDICTTTYHSDGVTIFSKTNHLGISKGLSIRGIPDNRFIVTNIIKNRGELLYSGGPWAPTCINPGPDKTFAISLGANDGATWDLIKMVVPRRFAGNTIPINDDQISFNEGYMLINPKGRVCKRCVYSAKGYIAMTSKKDNISFIKKVKSVRDGSYQMSGCNMAIFVGQDNFMVEMETYGEEKVLYPGEVLEHEETWILMDESLEFSNHEYIDSII